MRTPYVFLIDGNRDRRWAPALAAGQTSAAIPRAADGKPNLTGIWQAVNTAAWDLQDHSAHLGIPAGQGVVEGKQIPDQPCARRRSRRTSRTARPPIPRPSATCRACRASPTCRFRSRSCRRRSNHDPVRVRARGPNIYMNRPASQGPIEWWMGDSRGRWEGDTLVVDVVHFTDQTWFDRAGNFHSEALHVVERYTLHRARTTSTTRSTIEDPEGVHAAVEDQHAALPPKGAAHPAPG